MNNRNNNSSQIEPQDMLRCLYCNKPIKEYLLVDIDEEETIELPFCDWQCMDAYKDIDESYFS